MSDQGQQPEFYGTVHTKRQLKKPVAIGLLVGAVLLVFFVGFFAWRKNHITLSTYNGFGIAIKVPKSYEQTNENGFFSFKEPGDATIAQSYVTVSSDSFSKSLSAEQFAQAKQTYNKSFVSGYAENYAPANTKLSNQEITETTVANAVVYRGSASVVQNGATVGTLRYAYTLAPSGGRMVAVYAHKGDGALKRASQTIIDSYNVTKSN